VIAECNGQENANVRFYEILETTAVLTNKTQNDHRKWPNQYSQSMYIT